MPKNINDYDKINDLLDLDLKNKSKYCYHCRSLNEGTKRFKSTLALAPKDEYGNVMYRCSKCGQEYPELIFDVKNFIELAAIISTNMSALLETYKVLTSCLPNGKITNDDIQNIKELISISDMLDNAYTKCEDLATRVADESTIVDLKEDSMLHQRAFSYNHPEY